MGRQVALTTALLAILFAAGCTNGTDDNSGSKDPSIVPAEAGAAQGGSRRLLRLLLSTVTILGFRFQADAERAVFADSEDGPRFSDRPGHVRCGPAACSCFMSEIRALSVTSHRNTPWMETTKAVMQTHLTYRHALRRSRRAACAWRASRRSENSSNAMRCTSPALTGRRCSGQLTNAPRPACGTTERANP